MIGQTISHYKILEKLGEGGMGVVYKAQDLKLNRPVALKFLPQHIIAKPVDKARFLQEAQAAALLNHPNICAIYAIHEDGDEQFIELEFVDGVTLRDRLPIEKTTEILDYAIQIGEALQEAHGKEIVHRDIKSENIMLNARGQVKVMDFGLAKLKGSMQLTQSSTTVGTLAYTAPEQVQGSQADPRSDIFSFGVVLYEMLTGRVPFRGEHQAALMYSIVNEEPEPLEKYRPSVAPEIASIVSKAIEKNPSDRYQSVSDLVVDLRRARRKSSGVSSTELAAIKDRDFRKEVQEIGLKTAAIPLSKGSSRRIYMYVAIGSIVVLAIAGYFLLGQRGEVIDSIAVMPLVNVGGDPNMDYLTDGITEAVINNLSRLHNLRVMSQTSVFKYKGKEIDPSEIGKAFNVRAVLTGRILRRENDLQVSVELVDTRDGKQFWGEQYNKPLSTIQGLQGDISKDISQQLRVQITGEDRATLVKAPTNNAEAYELFLRARLNWNQRNAAALLRAVELYNQAIAKDPTYAQAYAGLAETYVLLPTFVFPPPSDAISTGKAFALKSLEINPNQAEAYSALAWAKWSEADIQGAEKEFRHAIDLNPNYATAHHWYGVFLISRNIEESLLQHRIARQLDPLSLVMQSTEALALGKAGRRDEAIRQFQAVLQADPNFGIARFMLGSQYLSLGNYQQAILEYQTAVTTWSRNAVGGLATAYALAGKKKESLEILAELEKLAAKGYELETGVASIYMGLGDREKALYWLNRVYEHRSLNQLYMGLFFNMPNLASMRSDPRIDQALKRIGFEK